MKYIRYSKIRLMLLNPNSLLRHFLKTCSINYKYMYFTFEKLNDRFELLPVACDFRLKDVIWKIFFPKIQGHKMFYNLLFDVISICQYFFNIQS